MGPRGAEHGNAGPRPLARRGPASAMAYTRLVRTASRGFLTARFASVCAGLAIVSACIGSAPEGIRRHTDGDGGDFGVDPQTTSTSSSAGAGLPGGDPHALLGADPTHGPFNGGQRVLLHGNGFSSQVRVWFGDVEVDPSAIVPIDPGRVQVAAPPGAADAARDRPEPPCAAAG